ncbi:hypothetical protein [Actinoplanes sp. NPDC049802]|uniref:hypothetical protein n=1 Tax=Actinoplanes sp. NPDC049802 TaxID=3154742 RepID=UPI0033CCD73D
MDWQIACPGPRGTTRSPKIEVQVKTSAEIEVNEGRIRHRLRVAHFNNLAGPGFQIPRFWRWCPRVAALADWYRA